ncbi:MAG: exonuclease SbcCD subunit D [Clostridiales bacterium]|nr:exonuclease SbcCD subunit D [Clostridiales bacterium]
MKFLHISDLHLGRQLHRFALQEEQNEILESIRQIAAAEKPDAILIAGDVYDRSIPPVYATQALDRFLSSLLPLQTAVCVISGNHDSAERLGFLSGPLAMSALHISPAYKGRTVPVTLTDEAGPVDIWLLPFLRPAAVRPFFPEEEIHTTNDAVACAIRQMPLDPTRRNVLVAHQFVAGASMGGSEDVCLWEGTGDVSVGGSDMVEAKLFSAFDYVALGHLHQAQNVGSERIRYCGTPLKYSFSELRSEKSVTVCELTGDRALHVRTIPLPEPRRMQELRGTFAEVTAGAANYDQDAYTHVILTDEHPIPDVMNRLRQHFPNITHLDWDNLRTRRTEALPASAEPSQHTPLALFAEFFERSNGAAMMDEQRQYLDAVIREIWEEEA